VVDEPHEHELHVQAVACVGLDEPGDSLTAAAGEDDVNPDGGVVDRVGPLDTINAFGLVLGRVRVLRWRPLVLRHVDSVVAAADMKLCASFRGS